MKKPPIVILIPILVLFAFFIWYFWGIILYIIIAAVLSLVGRPLMVLMDRIKWGKFYILRSIQAILTLLVLLLITVLLIFLFIPVIIQQTQHIENINIQAIEESLKEPIATIENFVLKYQLTDSNISVEEYFREKVVGVINTVRIQNLLNSVLGYTGDFLISIFSITFITFFFLKERDLLVSFMNAWFPKGYETRIQKVTSSVRILLTRYFIGVLLEILLVGGLISLGLLWLGVENAVAIGFFAGIFNVIPYLGPIIGALTGISFTILGNLELDFYAEMIPLILKVIVVFLIVQLIDNLVFQPFIYSSSVKAHPLEIFLVILMAGSFAGVGGMILAIPTYTILRVIAKEFLNQFKFVQSITKSI